MREIDQELVKSDLERASSQFETQGGGSDQDRAAQMVVQSLQVLRNRVGKNGVLKLVYFDNPKAIDLLPGVAMDVVEGLRDGKINGEEAERILDEAMPKYVKVFGELGIKPESISVLWQKGDQSDSA